MLGLRSAALVVLSASLGGCEALLWRPSNPKVNMWDVWLFADPSNARIPFYMNYLATCLDPTACGPRSPGGPANAYGFLMADGVGGATSSDGVFFQDQGTIIRKDKDAFWLGSGSVLRNADGEYVMNFSEDCEYARGSALFSHEFAGAWPCSI
jgi:hypothetical protein